MVLDVFTLDAITEMLQSPLRFLSYINRRTGYTERLQATHETIILSFHLKQNLWVGAEWDQLMLGDDISADLDVAMSVRRDGVDGERTPKGILTRLGGTPLGEILSTIEARPDPRVIEFGFLLLSLSGTALDDLNNGIIRAARLARSDGDVHDISVGFDADKEGITIHCNYESDLLAESRLRGHCALRKYISRATRWHGICLHPGDQSLRLGLTLDYPWVQDSKMDSIARGAQNLGTPSELRKKRVMPGRNDPCFCGSGLKFKKCHGR